MKAVIVGVVVFLTVFVVMQIVLRIADVVTYQWNGVL